MSEYKLVERIIALSQSKEWETARLEWVLDTIYFVDDAKRCLCGHYPIKEICVLFNQRNKATTEVGNWCVNKFIGLPSNRIFQAIKRIRKDFKRSINIELLDYAYQKGWVNDNEYQFSLETMRKRKFHEGQLEMRITLHKRILDQVIKEKMFA